MIQNALKEIGGVGLYGIVSVCLFFFVFGTAMVWSACLKRSFLQSMERLPLEDGTVESARKGENRHE